MLEQFRIFLRENAASQNTSESYILHVKGYMKWYAESTGDDCKKLFRVNILDYIAFMKNIKKYRASTINAKLAALDNYNRFLIEQGVQNDDVINKKDYVKVQGSIANPNELEKSDIEAFRQKVLASGNKYAIRDHAIITLLAYAGLRVSELCVLELQDVDLTARQVLIRSGKEDKERVVYINDVIVNSIREYLKDRNSETPQLFISRKGGALRRRSVEAVFEKYSDTIMPHKLKHFYCSHALESGYELHEVANQAGHQDVRTTMRYEHPSTKTMREKANKL